MKRKGNVTGKRKKYRSMQMTCMKGTGRARKQKGGKKITEKRKEYAEYLHEKNRKKKKEEMKIKTTSKRTKKERAMFRSRQRTCSSFQRMLRLSNWRLVVEDSWTSSGVS